MAVQLHLLHVNVAGLRARQAELGRYLVETRPDVLLLNETKMGSKPTPRLTGFYAAAVRNRAVDKVQGGGVAIYVRKGLTSVNISPDCRVRFING